MLKSAQNGLVVTIIPVVYHIASFGPWAQSPKAFGGVNLWSVIRNTCRNSHSHATGRCTRSPTLRGENKRKRQPEPEYLRRIRGRSWFDHTGHSFLCDSTLWNTVSYVVLVVLICHSVVAVCLAAQHGDPLPVLGESPTIRFSIERRACLLLQRPEGRENRFCPLLGARTPAQRPVPGGFTWISS